MSKFAYYDAPNKAQEPSISFETFTRPDEHTGPPWEEDEGFWPSTDSDAPGYVPPDKYESEMRKAQEREAAFQRGNWYYVGVIVRAVVSVPVGGKRFATYTLESPGLWGVASDCADYLEQVAGEQKAEMLHHLRRMGAFLAALPDE